MLETPSLTKIKEGAVILIDKPYTWTSFDALNKIRRQINTKIGHCGTLDPLATGLLICCTGKMTKQISTFQKQEKEYTGIIQLGSRTPTFDLESEPIDEKPYHHLKEEEIIGATKQFTGIISQVPPAHSAIKKDGVRAYKSAREGIEVKMEPRQVEVKVFEITKVDLPEVHFKVVCSTGTYIRSLANDLGVALECGAYLKELRRTKIGAFSVDEAMDVKQWIEYLNKEKNKIEEENQI